MKSIQDVGKEILSGNPDKFYIFVGPCYGVKQKYISILRDHYGESKEYDSFDAFRQSISRRSLIPASDKLHICRYDESFIKSLDKGTNDSIDAIVSKITGTMILIYQNPKHCDKCSKYLPDYTTYISNVSKQFIQKYITADYPKLSSTVVSHILSLCNDYTVANTLCESLSYLSTNTLSALTMSAISDNFMYNPVTSDIGIKQGIAARNFDHLLNELDRCTISYDTLFYSILSTLVELEKLLNKANPKSEFYNYRKCWNEYDLYYAFDLVYSELKASRNLLEYNTYDRLIYLFAVLCSSPIVPRGQLSWS